VSARFPQDAVLDLPQRGYSWRLQEPAVTFTQSGPHEHAWQFLEAAAGITIGKAVGATRPRGRGRRAGSYPGLPHGQERQPAMRSPPFRGGERVGLAG
jgi:hypothetical protein